MTCEIFLLLWKDIFSYPVPLSMIRKYDDHFINQSWFVVIDVICRRTNIWNSFALPAIMGVGFSIGVLRSISGLSRQRVSSVPARWISKQLKFVTLEVARGDEKNEKVYADRHILCACIFVAAAWAHSFDFISPAGLRQMISYKRTIQAPGVWHS